MNNGKIVRLRWSRAWLPVLLIVLAGVSIYSNTWHSPFLFDDLHLIVNSEARRTLYLSVARWFGTRSLPIFSFDLNYYFNKYNVVGYHIVNVGIHILSSIGVFWLAYWLSSAAHKTKILSVGKWQITNHLFFALVAGLIFVAHPLQTQAVTYIVQRLASMATLFYIGALLFYVKFRLSEGEDRAKIWGGLSLAATVAAMHSKEIAVTIPVVILMLEIFFFTPRPEKSRWWKLGVEWSRLGRRWYVLLLWLLTILIVPFYMLGVRELIFRDPNSATIANQETFFDKVNVKRIGDVSAETRSISRATYFMTEINVVRTYWRLVVWPKGQNLDHDYPLTSNFFNRATLLSLMLHIFLLALAGVAYWRGWRVAAFGVFFFYLALLPESSVMPITDVMFEHRLYLPMVGISLLAGDLGQGMMGWTEKRRSRKISANLAVLVLFGVVIIGLAVTAYRRNAVWRDEVSIWSDAVAKSPNKARPHNNLGKAYLNRKMFDKAEELYLQELELNPNSASAHNNLGSIYGVQGKYDKAIESINRALAIRPDHDAAYNNLGNVYMLKDNLKQAEEAYRKSIELNSKDAGVWRNLGDVLTKQAKYGEAVNAYRRAIDMVPDNSLWYSKLGAALGAQGKYDEAKKNLLRAIELNPKLAGAYSNLGNVYFAQRKYEEAAKAYVTYLQFNTGDVNVMNNLGKVLWQMDKKDKAKEVFAAVLKLDKKNKEAKKYLGVMTND